MTTINIGIIGITEGNGHPYSFSSIVNGYSDRGFRESEWRVIHEYLQEKDPAEFGFEGVQVTHAWTQDEAETERLCQAARIPNPVSDRSDLRSAVDGVIIARGDHENHFEMATPFLEDGTPVFVDKPLSLDPAELETLRPSLERGQLMSCSGMRFARELDEPRAHRSAYGDFRLVRGAVINDWEHYGVHMLDAIFAIIKGRPAAVTVADTDAHVSYTSAAIEMDDGTHVQVDTLGDVPMTFAVDVFGTDRTSRHDLRDNFTAFRRTLWRFVESIRDGDPAIPPEETLDVMRVLIAGRIARGEGRRVPIDELDV
jgi:predicted dehydrogenase